jgi:hypothetical protein
VSSPTVGNQLCLLACFHRTPDIAPDPRYGLIARQVKQLFGHTGSKGACSPDPSGAMDRNVLACAGALDCKSGLLIFLRIDDSIRIQER